jgi:REP element-mobilizing transposase RayT
MPRIPRFNQLVTGGIYHTMSRLAISEQFSDDDKDVLVKIIHHFTKIYFTKVFSYCVMNNHFHLIIQMKDYDSISSETDFKRRYKRYQKGIEFIPRYQLHRKEDVEKLKEKWASLSELLKDIKLTFTRYYNDKYQRFGFLWGGRFKSVILEKGNALINCMAYVDLNPIRAGLVKVPEKYRWSSIYYHVIRKNGGNWLSLDYANPFEDNNFNSAKTNKEKLIFYRKYMYQTGIEPHYKDYGDDDAFLQGALSDKIFDDAESKDFKYSFKEKFMHQCRYFSDSLIVGSYEFVKSVHGLHKSKLAEKRKRRFSKINGYENIYSMRNLRKNVKFS